MKKRIIISVFMLVFYACFIGGFRLHWLYAAVLLILSQAYALFYYKISRKGECAKEDYYEVTVYMEQFLCSYKRLGHVRMAWEDCCNLFEEKSNIYQAIQRAIYIMETGGNGQGKTILSGAFCEIESIYNSRRLEMMHRYIAQIEKTGGEVITAIDMMLGDLQSWKQRTAVYQKKKSFLRKEFFLAAVFALLMCCATHMILPCNIVHRVENMTVYQVSTTVVLVSLPLFVLFVYNNCAKSWLDSSHRFGDTLEEEFPYWLWSVSLYLQQDSVYHALQQSCHGLRGELAEEVRRLLENIYEQPNSLIPYVQFFRNRDLPELHSGMKLLYSFSSNGNPDIQKQVYFLVEQNQRMIEQRELNRQQIALSAFQLVKQVPMLIAGGKIVLDAFIFVLQMAQG